MTTTFENSKNGYRVKVSGFWSFFWTSLIGPFYFLARGNTRHFFFGLFLAILTLPWLIYPFYAAKILRTMYLERGYRVVEERAGIEKIAVPAALLVLLLIVAAIAAVVHFETPAHTTLSPSPSSSTSERPATKASSDDSSPAPQVRQVTAIEPTSPNLPPIRTTKTNDVGKSSIPAPTAPSAAHGTQQRASDPLVAAFAAAEMEGQTTISMPSPPAVEPKSDPSQDFARARSLSKGDGVTQDLTEAARYYRRAAESGYPPAQHQLGVAYAKGWGVEQNDREAVIWYQKAAENGLPEAQHDLAVRYILGLGLAKDIEKGVEWYRKAAAQGWQESVVALRRYDEAAPQSAPLKVAIVSGIADDDFLSVRAAAAMNSQELFRLSKGQEIQIRGDSVYNGDTEWIPVSLGSQQGWVRKKYVQFR
jgi:TPR repeat protein